MRPVGDDSPTFTRTARRRQIVNAAIDLIAEVGWAQTSIRKVADRVGIAMSAVQYHFGTRDGLVDAIVEHTIRAAIAAVGPAVSVEVTASDKLAAYIRASVSYYNEHRGLLAAVTYIENEYRPGGGAGADERRLDPALREEVKVLDPTGFLTDGRESGEFNDFPVATVAIALRAAIHAAVENILRDPHFDALSYGEDLTEIFGRAVGAKR
ncbi:TetR/AcrR family transcriptional regulator [Mycolicibacterium setense]